MDTTPFELPRVRTLLWNAAPRIFEGVVLPLAVFLAALRLLGVAGAVIAGLGVAYLAVGWRLATRRKVPGILALGALTLTARSVLMLLTGSTVVYFLQPTLSTALVGLALAISVPARRPLAERLARDFCPLPPDVLAHLALRRFFERITLLWSAVQVLNAVVTIWLLLTESVGTFVVIRTAISLALTGGAIAASVVSFQRCMRDHPLAHREAHAPQG